MGPKEKQTKEKEAERIIREVYRGMGKDLLRLTRIRQAGTSDFEGYTVTREDGQTAVVCKKDIDDYPGHRDAAKPNIEKALGEFNAPEKN